MAGTQNILDLPRDQFAGYLNELSAQGVDTSELMRQYRRHNSIFSKVYDWAAGNERAIADEGRTTAGAGLLSKEAGTTGMDALASVRLEPSNFISGFLSGMFGAADAPAAAAQGLIPQEDMQMESLNTASNVMLGGAAPMGRGIFDYDPNTARVFAGANSRTADLSALAKARELTARRRDPVDIWNETGWFKGPDGQWRYEINDAGLVVDPTATQGHGLFPPRVDQGPEARAALANEMLDVLGASPSEVFQETGFMRDATGKLVDFGANGADPKLLAFPELASAYPASSSLRASSYASGDKSGLLGYFDRVENSIGLAGDVPDANIRSTAAHELQHFIQSQEGFARGGVPYGASRADLLFDTVSNGHEIINAIRGGNVDAIAAAREKHGPIFDVWESAAKEFPSSDAASIGLFAKRQAGELATDAYRSLGGEVESRVVERRLNMTPEERAARFPMLDYDAEVPIDAQTFTGVGKISDSLLPEVSASSGGFDEYLRRVNPQGYRVDANDRPNLMMGDMYGMLPRDARKVGERDGISFYQSPDGASYATSFNPDVGEMDVVGYAMPRGNMTDLAVVNEMQGKGIGSELQYLMRSQDPYAPTGGLTDAGEASLRRTYNRLRDEGIVSANASPLAGLLVMPTTEESVPVYSPLNGLLPR